MRRFSTPTSSAREISWRRFLTMVADHKRKIGFEGTLLIEPKPAEPTKHQYDYDCQSVHGFLERYDLVDEYRVNIEGNHATLAGHSFHHEVAYAVANGIFGSIDANRGDYQNGWDTDQFPNSVDELSLVLYEILQGGGFTTGGFNFDTKLRRQSMDRTDLFHGHIGGIDTLARALLVAADLVERETLSKPRAERYQGGRATSARGSDRSESLASLATGDVRGDRPDPVSGRQELLENRVNSGHVERPGASRRGRRRSAGTGSRSPPGSGHRVAGLSLRRRARAVRQARPRDRARPRPATGIYRFHGGHRLWAAPEIPAITYAPDDHGARCAATARRLAIRRRLTRPG